MHRVRVTLLVFLLILLLASVIDAIAVAVDARGAVMMIVMCVVALVLEWRAGGQ